MTIVGMIYYGDLFKDVRVAPEQNEIDKLWTRFNAYWDDAIYKEWLPSSAYAEAYSCTIERYDGNCFKGWGDPESEIEIWVLIKTKA